MRQRNKLLRNLFILLVLFGWGLSMARSAPKEELLLGSRPVKLIEHNPPHRAEQCQNCHMKKEKAVFARKRGDKLVKEHGNISNIHGAREVSCHNCHDPNNSNFLKSTDDYTADWKNPSPVCSNCHAIIFQAWRRGLHGKRTSGSDGVREQLHCINCHNHHSVKFKKMEALPAPKKPKFLIEKDGE